MNDTITIKAEGKLPGEELAVAWLAFQGKMLDYMTQPQRERWLDRMDHIEQFFDDLGSPLRNLAATLREVGKAK